MGSSNVWGRVGKVKCPVKVLHAETNSTLRPQSEKIVRRKQRNWQIEQVMGASHFLPMEFTELVQQNLRALPKL
jgi:pimeloyl-ACP methyl ester carboxylesterase